MSTYINNNVKFHTFSKSPVSGDTTLGGAVNPSGHTITTSQVHSQDIPAFLNTFQNTKEQALTWLSKNYATPAHNDIVYYGGEFKAGFDVPKCLKYNTNATAWEDFDITKATTLKNADDKDVIAVHTNCTTVFVDGGNNAATNSNRWSLFVKRSDNTILDHFVASTDKIVAGMPSLGYNALVLWNNAAIDEGELEANYVGNTFAGIVHLNKQYSDGDDAKFKVTCFEYIGDKLNTNITNIKSSVSKLEKAIETEINDRIEADAELTTKIEERFESLSDELEKHIEESCNTGISNIDISGDNFIKPEKTNTGWSLTLNNSTDISSSNTDGDKKVPTVNAVKKYVDTNLVDPTIYLFPDLPIEERKYYMIFDAWQNPIYMSFANEIENGFGLFRFRRWKKFHIDMPNLTNAYRTFHSNIYLESFKSDLSSLTALDGTFAGCYNLQYFEADLSALGSNNNADTCMNSAPQVFKNCRNLKYIKVAIDNIDAAKTFITNINQIENPNMNITDKKMLIGHNVNGIFTLYNIEDIQFEHVTSLINKGWLINQ